MSSAPRISIATSASWPSKCVEAYPGAQSAAHMFSSSVCLQIYIYIYIYIVLTNRLPAA